MKAVLKNGKTVEIRHGAISDAKRILDYMYLIHRQTKNLVREPEEFKLTLEEEEAFIKKVEASNEQVMLIALDGEKVISTSGFHGSGLKRVKHRVSLGISILEDYRGLGLGKILMLQLEKEAIKLGKTKIDLEVRKDNIGAIKLYEKVGYKHEGEVVDGFFVDNTYVNLLKMGLNLRR